MSRRHKRGRSIFEFASCSHPELRLLSNELVVELSRRGWPRAFLIDARQAGGRYCAACNRVIGHQV